jgi:hypothetical protein
MRRTPYRREFVPASVPLFENFAVLPIIASWVRMVNLVGHFNLIVAGPVPVGSC